MQQGRAALRERDTQAEQRRPQTGGRTDGEGVGHTGSDLVQIEPARPRTAEVVQRHELEERLQVVQQTQLSPTRILNSDDSAEAFAHFQQRDGEAESEVIGELLSIRIAGTARAQHNLQGRPGLAEGWTTQQGRRGADEAGRRRARTRADQGERSHDPGQLGDVAARLVQLEERTREQACLRADIEGQGEGREQGVGGRRAGRCCGRTTERNEAEKVGDVADAGEVVSATIR